MRCREISKEDRTKLVTEALQKMKGKIHEIAGSHISSRVLQTCVKHCSQDEKDAVFEELRPHFLALAYNAYAVHLVKKMLDSGNGQLEIYVLLYTYTSQLITLFSHWFSSIFSLKETTSRFYLCSSWACCSSSSPHGWIIVEHAYELASAAKKQELLLELYSTELKLSKDLVSLNESR
ncbi:hypothetical protein Lalb_Chr12g0201101 [Lupinus albus]|uniref:PUM-HD domain-containing protein n=1 Tax=Lupinus albus TaxID=3870 RepID=A0A6A4PM95_LUPAL|nr:hypothetical protein Lalb_Chr12g0201101 [Lupinus albus]